MSQVLFKDEQRSCAAAVARVVVLLVALGRKPCSEKTGAYCKARAKLPEKVIERLTLAVADGCERQRPEGWLWHGRHVHLVDGATVSMPDTPENQGEYPQSSSQEEGLGFPIARMVVLLWLATAMLTGMAMGPCLGKETGEPALLRELLERFQQGEILLADRYYCSYFMIVLLLELGVDFVVRDFVVAPTCRLLISQGLIRYFFGSGSSSSSRKPTVQRTWQPSFDRTIIMASTPSGSRRNPSSPNTLSAVAQISAVTALGASTVAERTASTGRPVRGSMMWL